MSFFVGNAKIKNGTINNSVIGGESGGAAAGTFTELTASTSLSVTDIDATAALTIDSTDTIGIGTDDVDKAINIGTDGIRTVTIGSTTQATTVALNTATVDILADDNTSSAILLRADGGTSETIKIQSSQGEGQNSIDLVSSAGGIKATAAKDIELDAAATVKLTGPTITLNPDASGAVNIDNDDGASTIQIGSTTGAKTINIDSSTGTLGVEVGKLDMKISGATANTISLAAATTLKVDNNDLTMDSGSGDIKLNSTSSDTTTGAIDINSTNGGTIFIDASGGASGGAVSVGATADSDFTVNGSAKSLTLSATGGGANKVIVSSAGTGSDAIHLNASDTTGGVDIDAGTGGVDIDTTGAIALDTSNNINIGVNTAANAINIGTKSDAPVVTIGEATINKNLTVTGNLLVSGNTVTQNVETMIIEDPIIGLRKHGTNAQGTDGDGGFIIEQNSNNKAFIWDNDQSHFTMIETTTGAADSPDGGINITDTVDLKIKGLTATGNIVTSSTDANLSIGGTTNLKGAVTAEAKVSATLTGGVGLEVSGDAKIDGDLEVGGGDLTASTTTADLSLFGTTTGTTTLPTGAINMSAADKLTAVKGSLSVAQEVGLASTLSVAGVLNIDGDTIKATTASANIGVFENTTGKVTLGGGAVDISASGSATTVLGSLDVDEAVTLTSTLSVASDIATNNGVIKGAADATAISLFTATTGDVTLGGSGALNLNGASNLTTVLGSLSVAQAAGLQSTLNVSGNTTVDANVTIGDALSVGEATILTSTLSVGNAAQFDSTLTVDGATTLANGASGTGAVNLSKSGATTSVKGILDVTQATTLTSTLSVASDIATNNGVIKGAADATAISLFTATTGDVTLGGSGALNLNGASNLTTVLGSLSVAQAAGLQSTLNVSGNTTVDANVTIGDALSVGEATILTSTLSVAKAVKLDSTLNVAGQADIATTSGVVNLSKSGSTTTVKGGLTVDQNATVTGTLEVNGGTVATATSSVGNALSLFGTTTGTTTLPIGAINMSASNKLTTVLGSLSVAQAAGLQSTLNVSGNTTVDANVTIGDALSVGEATTLTSTLSVGGDSKIDGQLDLSGNIGSLLLPKGTTGQESVGQAAGGIRFNTDDSIFEGYDGSSWASLGGVRSADGGTLININEDTDNSGEGDVMRFYVDDAATGSPEMTLKADELSIAVATVLQSTLDVTGDTSVSTFDSTGATTLASSSGAVTLATASENTIVLGKLSVAGATQLISTVDIGGLTKINDGLSISGNLSVEGNFYQHLDTHTTGTVSANDVEQSEYHILDASGGNVTVVMPTSGTAGQQASFIVSDVGANNEAYLTFASAVVLPGVGAATANLKLDTVGQGAMFIHNGTKWFQVNGGYSDSTTT